MKRRSANGMKVLVLTVCVLLVVALVTAGNSTMNGLFTGLIFAPLQKAAAGFTTSAGEGLSSPADAEELEKENKKLREENNKLSSMLVEYYELKKENEELYKFYNIKKDNDDFSLVPSTVISRDPNENFYGFILDKGSQDGISEKDPVMTENGLVGFVSEVNLKSCKVTTLLSPDAKIGSVDKKTENQGIITGSPEYCDDNITVMKNISAQNEMKKGEIVVTSGYGGLFPKNVRIGTIRELKYDYDGMPVALIDPSEDIRNITSAAVITSFSGKGEINEYKKPSQEKPES